MNRLSLDRAREILERARGVSVLVVGDLMLDEYILGRVDRISPEAPVPVVLVEGERRAVGGAANVAANVAALGAGCRIVGLVGRDHSAGLLRDELSSIGVDLTGVVESSVRPTTVKTRLLAKRQQVARFDRETDGDASSDEESTLREAVAAGVAEADAVALEDYNKGVLVPGVIRTVLDEARARGIPTVVDPKRLRFFEYEGATVFKPNEKELAEALGETIRPDEPEWLEGVRRRLGCENLLLTRGESGMALGRSGGTYMHIPAVARAVFDVSGAGDTVTAAMAVGLAAGATVEEAAILANHAAGLEVGKPGVATVSTEEILAHHEEWVSRGPASGEQERVAAPS